MSLYSKLLSKLRGKKTKERPGSATPSSNRYQPTSGQPTFPTGSTRSTFSVPILMAESRESRISENELLRMASRNCSTYTISDPLYSEPIGGQNISLLAF